MKKIINVFAVYLACCSAAVFASSDIHLKITDAQAVSQVVKCPDGACVVNNLKKGKYNVVIEEHAPQASAVDSPGRQPSIEVLQLNASVMSPRDAGSGMATGRRQYAPVIIRKDMAKGVEIIVADDGSTLSVVGVAVSPGSLKSTLSVPAQRATTDKK